LVPGAQVSPASHRFAQGLSGAHTKAADRAGSAMRSAVPVMRQSWQSDGARPGSSVGIGHRGSGQIRKSRQAAPLAELHSALRQLHCPPAAERVTATPWLTGAAAGLRPHIRCSTNDAVREFQLQFCQMSSSHIHKGVDRPQLVHVALAKAVAKSCPTGEETGCGQRFGQLVKIAAVLGESVTQKTPAPGACARDGSNSGQKTGGPPRPGGGWRGAQPVFIRHSLGLARRGLTIRRTAMRSARFQGFIKKERRPTGIVGAEQAQQSLKLLGPLTPRSKKYQTANATVDKMQEACDDRDSGERDIWPSEQQEESRNSSQQPTSQVTPSTFIISSSSNYASLSVSTERGAAEPPAAPAAPRLPPIRKAASTSGLEGWGPPAGIRKMQKERTCFKVLKLVGK
uniref:SH2 domain containing 5 n=1 Tax=Macrostomum lignano TaxID=282301 RepID=A0A1I8F9H0_9PLAT